MIHLQKPFVIAVTCIRYKLQEVCCAFDGDFFYVHQVCLAKANSTTSLDTVVIQDLNLGEGQAVENGDSLEVVYTGWLLQNHAIGQVTHFRHCLVNFLILSPVPVFSSFFFLSFFR